MSNASTKKIAEKERVTCHYDSLGKRRIKAVGDETHYWRWDAGYSVVTEYKDQTPDWNVGALQRFFVPFGHTALAEVTPGAGGSVSTGAYTYLAHDHLGTTRKGYNQAKTEIHSNEHLPFGQRLSTTGTVPYHEWTGKPWDAESQMYYFPYRYYSPVMNRWTATDPLGLVDGPNLYGYVGGNPIMYIDPEGGSWLGVLGIAVIAYSTKEIIEATYKIKLKAQIQNENIKLSKKIDEAEARLRERRYCLEERHMLFFHNLRLSIIVESAYQGGAQEIIELLFSFIF